MKAPSVSVRVEVRKYLMSKVGEIPTEVSKGNRRAISVNSNNEGAFIFSLTSSELTTKEEIK